LGADGKPTVIGLNKIDRLSEVERAGLPRRAAELDLPSESVPISALRGYGIGNLLVQIETALEADAGFVPVQLTAPFERSDLVDRFHQLGRVEATRFDEGGTTLDGWLPETEMGRFAPYLTDRLEAQPLEAPSLPVDPSQAIPESAA
ncbi:MAG: hypothetical protein M3R06_02440, partial [Chloroflexota bacterium]|nr:hypothetical protein [Chloroflexota bacterium]